MAAYCWVGGTGTWSGTGNTQFAVISGGVATALNPTNADTVTFDANSGTAATVTVTSTAVSLSTTVNKSDINLSLSGSPTLCTAAGTCTLTAGTLTLNTFTLSTGSFSSTNSNTRVLNFGTGNITLTGVSTIIFNTTTVTGMTITGTPVVNCTATTGTSVQTRTFIAGAHGESQSISVNINPGTSAVDIFRFATNSGAFKDITFSSTFTGTIQISNTIIIYGNFDSGGATVYTGPSTVTFAATSGTKTIKTSGLVIDSPITFNGVGGTWQLQDALTSGSTRTCTLTAGTLNLNGYSLTTGIFSSSNSNTRTLALGSIGKISITGSGTTVCNTSTATNLTVTGGSSKLIQLETIAVGTRTITGASVATAIEGTNLLDYYFVAGSDTVTFTDNCAYNTINFSFFGAFTGTLTNNAIFIYGNFAVSSSMILTSGTNALSFKSTTGTVLSIEPNGQTFNNPITFDGINGVWAFTTALTMGSTQALTLVNGYVKLAESVTSTVGSFVTTGTNQKYLGSRLPGTQATISDASGTNSVSYLTIQDSNATGGATWNALALTNVNAGNNTGWSFIVTPSVVNEITMRLRSFTQPRRF
jgi:hypothetical protein